ncbi:hypothetical protein CEN48_06935 [Fischerella thermalis CCMEE 5282]|uniref:hypothetical protein n=1 Tax=Fischerella thermalis TaxID=372787 RepID=UPI000C802D21|nr:hypothetical protein [Fischerella thermalis]PMB15355.1 hypothetical protein CEN48_06935 [Fischerella thermalis CCMEE 5282]
MKTEGWRTLLQNSRFCDQLHKVNLFVASNHGQEDGYCSDIFNYCNPNLIIISNGDRHQLFPTAICRYERQMRMLQKPSGQPKILTTRNAGTITIQKSLSNAVRVITQRSKTYQLQQTEVYPA